MALALTVLAALFTVGIAHAQDARWRDTPHGAMLERVLPRSITPDALPDAGSPGAQAAARYCVQCHHLPNPAMHSAERWNTIVKRMVWRMGGGGNLGAAMKDLMAGVTAPDQGEEALLIAYFRQHAQRELDADDPRLRSTAGRMYALACTQCHALPDPQRHTAREWPAVVERMKRHMAWANTVTGHRDLRTTPELKTADIVALLQRHARREP